MPTVAAKCTYCPNPAEGGKELCGPCFVEMSHLLMDGEPEREFLKCVVCSDLFRYTEARVLRYAKNPRAPLCNHTPVLCWVCSRLHISAAHQEKHSAPPIF